MVPDTAIESADNARAWTWGDGVPNAATNLLHVSMGVGDAHALATPYTFNAVYRTRACAHLPVGARDIELLTAILAVTSTSTGQLEHDTVTAVVGALACTDEVCADAVVNVCDAIVHAAVTMFVSLQSPDVSPRAVLDARRAMEEQLPTAIRTYRDIESRMPLVDCVTRRVGAARAARVFDAIAAHARGD